MNLDEKTRSCLRITLAYNLRRSDDEGQAERLGRDYVELLRETISGLGHRVTPVEVSGTPSRIVSAIVDSKPQLIFNVAEGTELPRREAYYPAIYEVLGLPYTGGGPALLYVGLDKRLMAKVFEVLGVKVPKGTLVTPGKREIPDDLSYPLFIKPNYQGSSMGIKSESLVDNQEEAESVIGKMLEDYPHGLDIEEFIPGRELTVPMLEPYPGQVLEIVEYEFKGDEHNIFDYEKKSAEHKEEFLETFCPPGLETSVRHRVLALADRAFKVSRARDFARADIRLHKNGTPYLIEVNPLPGLRRISPMITAAEAKGLEYSQVIARIIASARKRYDI